MIMERRSSSRFWEPTRNGKTADSADDGVFEVSIIPGRPLQLTVNFG